jgi:hypothetical protein
VCWTLECNKLPLWIEPCEFVTISPKSFENMAENIVNLLTLKYVETIIKMRPKNEKVPKIVFKLWKNDEKSENPLISKMYQKFLKSSNKIL